MGLFSSQDLDGALFMLEQQSSYLVINFGWQSVNSRRKGSAMLRQIKHRQSLKGKAHIHDFCRMAIATGQIDQAAFRQDMEAAAIGLDIGLHSRPGLLDRGRQRHELPEIDFDIEMAGIA